MNGPGTRPDLPVTVHVVRVDLDHGDHVLDDLVRELDDEERRAAFARPARGMRRYVVAHAALRAAVGAAAGVAPRDVRFGRGSRGQPLVAIDGVPVHASLSHSVSDALVAVSLDAPVGVDVEVFRARRIDALARRTLTPAELDAVMQVPARARQVAFHRYWVRKEALLKATGEGIARLREVTATPAPPGWTVLDLPTAAGRWAALAVPAVRVEVLDREWPTPPPDADAAGC